MSNNRICKNNTSSALQIGMIILGIAITPILLSSSSIGNQLASGELLKIVSIGAVILAVLAVINLMIGEHARLPTYGIIKYQFGEKGAIAINVLMAISLFGWIAVTANMFGHSVHDLLAQYNILIPFSILVVIGCIICVAATAFGIAVLGKMAQVALPIIALLLVYILYLSFSHDQIIAHQTSHMNFGVAVSTVVGTIIVLVTTLPDFGSFIHNRKHAIIAGIASFLFAYPVLYWAGSKPSALTGQGSLLGAMAIVGAVLPGALLLIIATISGNAGNIFQGTLVISTLFSRFSKRNITIILGIAAAIVGCMDIVSWFIPFLLFLGVTTPPVAGIYIADFILYRRQGYDENQLKNGRQIKLLAFAAWLIGALVGFITIKGIITLTTIPSLDSIVVASLCYALFSIVQKK